MDFAYQSPAKSTTSLILAPNGVAVSSSKQSVCSLIAGEEVRTHSAPRSYPYPIRTNHKNTMFPALSDKEPLGDVTLITKVDYHSGIPERCQPHPCCS